MSENIVSIKNLNKEYKMYHRKRDRLLEALFPNLKRHDKFKALQDFDLELNSGEVLGVLGKNGAGKSTLLKMITGVVTPTSGTIKVNGKISSLLELGTAFNMELTGIENIYQHGQVMGLTNEQIEEKKQEIIDFADIGDHLYQPVKTYSSGMFARLAFSCAINVEPDVLIVDEVLSVGDMAFQLKCFKKFQQFKEKGKTILFVTHSINDVLNNCNRTIILDSGKKIFDGDVKEGVENYKKLITGMLDLNGTNQEENRKLVEDRTSNDISINENQDWKSNFTVNPDRIVYGNKEAEIYDYGIFNQKGEPQTIVSNDEDVSIKLKVRFNQEVESPTFSITIKDFNGKEICGTNTSFLDIYTGKCLPGEKYVYEFNQKLRLAAGKYTLSISCSRYDYDGNIIVMNRNYDALIFEVTSNKKTVGYFYTDTKVSSKKITD